MTTETIAVYIHIPFCESKCHYCDFASYAGMASSSAPYVAAVAEEAQRFRIEHPGLEARTVYFGGGTPTLLGLDHFAQILAALPPARRGAEVTVEANPSTLTGEFLRGLCALGINRLSLGVQCFDDEILRRIGRRHDSAGARASYEMIRAAGFENVSLDLIYGLPGQDLAGWRDTLRQAIGMAPEHLSLYALTIEEKTAFGRLCRRGELTVPDDDAQADMYLIAEELLDAAGYEHYEISNWAARRGSAVMYARHNLVYWRNEPYLGLGAAAHSFFDRRRIANTPRVRPYLEAVRAGRSPAVASEEIGLDLEMAETLMMGLRLAEGVSFQRFAERFGLDLRERYREQIEEVVTLGLLAVSATGIALSPRGRLLGNEVFARFLPGAGPML